MATSAVISRKARGIGALTLVWLLVGLGLLAGSTAALYFSSRNDLLAAYNSAPACATLADAAAGKDCRYTATATVRQVAGDNGSIEIYFEIPGQYAPSFLARLPVTDTPLKEWDTVKVELWQMKVTRLGGVLTSDNPANDPRPRTLLVIGLLLLPFGAGATAWGVVRARRHTQGAISGPGMGPVAMSDVLWR